MPQVFKIGSFVVFMWFAEGVPLEPIHVHVCEGVPTNNATKIWITKNHKTLLCHNKSNIPFHKLNTIMKIIEARASEIETKWKEYFGQLQYYC
jgi:hypothetical protein